MLGRLGIACLLLCVLTVFSTCGQSVSDSAQVLKTVMVTHSRLNDHSVSVYELPIDSTSLSLASNGSLTDLLRKQGFGHIRTYGPGGLASASFRGTGSSHTAVLWNGISLVSPLSGQLDLSLLPAALFDDVAVQTGGSTSLSGNGSIGGNIHLNNDLNFNEGLGITASSFLGSFGSQFYDFGLDASNARFGTSTKIFYTVSENDFEFTNRSFNPPETQRREHSRFEQHGALQQLHWQMRHAGVVSLKLWYQKSEYEVPNPTTVARPSQAEEQNEFYRALAGWNYHKGNFGLLYQSAFIQQDLEYADPLIDLHSSNRFNSVIQNVETNISLKNNNQLTSGIHYTWEKGIVDDFGGNSPVRNRVAVFSAYKIESVESWQLAISGREEFVNGDAMPFAPALSARYAVSGKTHLFANLSRNYRLPTFNDLYWTGVGAHGNPDLKTETSLSAEGGYGKTGAVLSFKGVVFSNYVDDWIQWLPVGAEDVEGPVYGQAWIPQNIKKVWARGVESQLSITKKVGAIRSQLTGQYSYTRSTNEKVYEAGNPNEKGKQLLLTPVHEASLMIEGEWKRFMLRIVNAYTGEQFNDSDNTPYNIVDDYLITNLWLSKSIQQKGLTLTITGEVNNLFDVDYEARPGYPLPGINYKVGVKVNFNKSNRI